MRLLNSTVDQLVLPSVLTMFAVAGVMTVPSLLTLSTFLALAGVLGGFTWVLKETLVSAQPARSIAQSLHDIDAAAAAKRSRARRCLTGSR